MGKDLFSLANKTIVYTGGCGNLGRVMVKELLEFGAEVAVFDIVDTLDESFDEYRKANKLEVLCMDLSKTESIRDSFAAVEKKFGKIDVLVNCAAYGGGAGGKACEYRLDKVDDETWERGVDGTLNVTFRCTREVIPYFDKIGGGAIVNIASMYGVIAPDFSIYGDNIPWSPPTYGAGKAGVVQFTKYCASALASRGIRVNSITPGPFPKLGANADMEFFGRLSNKTMLHRTGKPEELNGALILLCSDAASFMTAENICVDGGMTKW